LRAGREGERQCEGNAGSGPTKISMRLAIERCDVRASCLAFLHHPETSRIEIGDLNVHVFVLPSAGDGASFYFHHGHAEVSTAGKSHHIANIDVFAGRDNLRDRLYITHNFSPSGARYWGELDDI
jgi:hypothetical protein